MKKINYKRLIIVSRLLFGIYLILALYFLLFAEGFGRTNIRSEYSYNLELLKEVKRYLGWAEVSDTGFKMMMLNVWGNIACFIPFGFFIPIIFKKVKNGIVVTILTFAFSLMVEVTQLIFKIGSFDVDDLLLNTIGGLIGFCVYWIIKKIIKRRGKK